VTTPSRQNQLAEHRFSKKEMLPKEEQLKRQAESMNKTREKQKSDPEAEMYAARQRQWSSESRARNIDEVRAKDRARKAAKKKSAKEQAESANGGPSDALSVAAPGAGVDDQAPGAVDTSNVSRGVVDADDGGVSVAAGPGNEAAGPRAASVGGDGQSRTAVAGATGADAGPEDAAEESPALLAPTALSLIRNEPPRGATENVESRAAGEIVCGAPFADEMDVDSVAEPGSNEEHAAPVDNTVPDGGPGGAGGDEDDGDDGGGALPFDDDGGGVAPMVNAGGDGGEGAPTLTEGATGSSANGPGGSATDGASVPSSPPPYAMDGAASISIGPASTAHVPTDGEDSSRSRSDRGSDQPTVSQVELAVLRGVNRVHVQEKKDLHDKLVEALVSNALLQKRVLVLEEQQQQQLHGAVQALPTDGTTQAREEEPDGPSRRADADRLRQLEESNSKLEEDLREWEELDRERDAATDAQAKQHLEAYEKLRGDLKAEKQARAKDVGDFQRQLNECGDRHKSELAALKRQHEAELDAKQKSIQDQERLVKKYKRENEELKKQGASVKAEPGRDPQPDQQRPSRVSVKEEPGRDPPPDQPRSSSISVKTEPRPDQPRSSNGASSSSAPRSNAKAEKGAAGTGKK
jgi:hypothetical protein